MPFAGLSLQVDSAAPYVTGTPVLFSASIISGSSPVYTWDFGDGTTGTGQSVSHTYAATGTYTVKVTATNTLSTLTAQTSIDVGGGTKVFLPLLRR